MRKTKIVCTIGPATRDVETLKEMIKAGMNVARINFSHGSMDEQRPFVEAVKIAREELQMPVALLLDTQGPEIRTGHLVNSEHTVELKEGDTFILRNDDIIGNEREVSVSYKNLYKDVSFGKKILIDDGKICLIVDKVDHKDIICKVAYGGLLGDRKSINVPECELKLPALKEKDIQDIKDGIAEKFDFISASFVRSAEDVKEIRKVLDENGGKDIKIISKIESAQGIKNFDEILRVSDGIMVARGDMGVEIPLEEVPIVQKKFIKACNRAGKLVITATQMLESMTQSPRPTRAEVSDVANAIYDGSGAIMLSGESATGKYPVLCVETMVKIAKTVEEDIDYWNKFYDLKSDDKKNNYEFNLNRSVCLTAAEMKAKGIVAYTVAGDTPRQIASFFPDCPVFAITASERTYRQLALAVDTYPILLEKESDIKMMMKKGIELLEEKGLLNKGDILVISGGGEVLDIGSTAMNRNIGGLLRV